MSTVSHAAAALSFNIAGVSLLVCGATLIGSCGDGSWVYIVAVPILGATAARPKGHPIVGLLVRDPPPRAASRERIQTATPFTRVLPARVCVQLEQRACPRSVSPGLDYASVLRR